jgi:superfamily II RNA helicase
VDTTLLSSSDTAAVKHIIAFHLHRKELDKVPQYHTIYNLLCRGIAFHHSGLLPVLKEIIEILFSKGFVKILFCTETFAVGLNMPTKTVLFSGFKKFDETGIRILRNDEYIQMAGRAGRRGKDDKGVVIYLPDHEPLEPYEMKMMMKGSKPPIISRMDFHYDFILKTIQVSKPGEQKWLEIMEQSYWFQQRQKQIAALTIDIEECKKKNITIEEPYYTECEKRYEIEIKMKLASKLDNKNFQRQLDSLKNRQLGPKWNTAWSNYNNNIKYRKECENIQNDIKELLMHKESIIPSIQYLCKLGYITDPTSLNLTLKGILATEVNEGHQILMTELYTQDILHTLTGEETVMILSCFQESDDNYIRELYVSDDVKNAFLKLKEIAKELEYIEGTIVYPVKDKYWNTSTELIEPMKKWMEGELASVICEEYGIFEGNFMRSIMKMANIVDEWISMATYCQHIEQVDKMMEVRKKIIREIPDSLYLHL